MRADTGLAHRKFPKASWLACFEINRFALSALSPARFDIHDVPPCRPRLENGLGIGEPILELACRDSSTRTACRAEIGIDEVGSARAHARDL